MSEALTATSFEQASAVTPLDDGHFRAPCDPDWFTPVGANGGLLAAIVVRAMTAMVTEPDRLPRSLTLHYLRPPVEGELDVLVRVERTGRRLTNLTARLEQAGRLCVMAAGAFSVDFDDLLEYADAPPSVPPPQAVAPAERSPEMPPIAHRFEMRPTFGAPPFSGADDTVAGGWIAFADGPEAIDAPALAMLTDAWLPIPFMRLREPVGAPTIDLTIHFRAPEIVATAPVLAMFTSRFAHAGFFEEDGELSSADGRLLAQSRQLALLTR